MARTITSGFTPSVVGVEPFVKPLERLKPGFGRLFITGLRKYRLGGSTPAALVTSVAGGEVGVVGVGEELYKSMPYSNDADYCRIPSAPCSRWF